MEKKILKYFVFYYLLFSYCFSFLLSAFKMYLLAYPAHLFRNSIDYIVIWIFVMELSLAAECWIAVPVNDTGYIPGFVSKGPVWVCNVSWRYDVASIRSFIRAHAHAHRHTGSGRSKAAWMWLAGCVDVLHEMDSKLNISPEMSCGVLERAVVT